MKVICSLPIKLSVLTLALFCALSVLPSAVLAQTQPVSTPSNKKRTPWMQKVFRDSNSSEELEAVPLPANQKGMGYPAGLKDSNFQGSLSEFWQYNNSKYGFEVRFPSRLIPQDDADESGQTFRSADSSAFLKIRAAMAPGVTLQSKLEGTRRLKQDAEESISYQKTGRNWFTIKSSKGQWQYCTKFIVDGDRVIKFELSYLKNKTVDYAPLELRMAASFRLVRSVPDSQKKLTRYVR